MLWLLCCVCSIIFAHGFDPLLPRIKLGEEHAVLLGRLKREFYGCSVTCWIPANVYYRQYSLMTFSGVAVPFLHIKACKYCIKTRLTTSAKLFLWMSIFYEVRRYVVTWLEVDEAEVHEQNNESCVGLKSCIDFLPWENLHKNVVVLTSLLLLGDHLQVIKLCKN